MTSESRFRPNDRDMLRSALRAVRTQAPVPILFGGSVHAQTLTLSEFIGTRTTSLQNLQVLSGRGIGGRCVEQRRGMAVVDYARAPIMHAYDEPVLAEGIRSVTAAPVVVNGETRMVLYAATRDGGLDDRVRSGLARTTSALAREFAISDEVDRRMELLREQFESREQVASAAVRDVEGRLRLLIGSLSDSELRQRLQGLQADLALATETRRADPNSPLAPRETEVLALVALGASYREVAAQLSLRPETVKSYMRSTMGKLGVGNRHKAVLQARTLRLLP